MILEGKDVVKTAGHQWSLKWVPAILGYAKSLKTKAAISTLKEANQLYSGMCYIFKPAAILQIFINFFMSMQRMMKKWHSQCSLKCCILPQRKAMVLTDSSTFMKSSRYITLYSNVNVRNEN